MKVVFISGSARHIPFVRKDPSMLVLSRKQGEEIIIGDDIHVRIVAISGNRVRLAFTAPKETRIHRAEIYWNIQAETPIETGAALAAEPAGCI